MTAISIFITIATIIFKIIGSQELCCDSTSYGTFSSWSMCKNAADPNLGSPDTCDTCVAYHCIDWLEVNQEIKYDTVNDNIQLFG